MGCRRREFADELAEKSGERRRSGQRDSRRRPEREAQLGSPGCGGCWVGGRWPEVQRRRRTGARGQRRRGRLRRAEAAAARARGQRRCEVGRRAVSRWPGRTGRHEARWCGSGSACCGRGGRRSAETRRRRRAEHGDSGNRCAEVRQSAGCGGRACGGAARTRRVAVARSSAVRRGRDRARTRVRRRKSDPTGPEEQ